MNPRPGWSPIGALALFAVATMVAPAGAPEEGGPARSLTYPMRTMGTYANLTVVTSDSSATDSIATAAQAALDRVDSLMSNWTTTSVIAHINGHAGRETLDVHPEVAFVLGRALEVARRSDGAFDVTVEPLVRLWGFLGGEPRVPDPEEIERLLDRVGNRHVVFDPVDATVAFTHPELRVDLGGIAKGYGVDAVGQVLADAGVTDALIDLSGNMLALGHPPGGESWSIGVRDPRDLEPYVATLALTDAAVATSGAYEQFVAEGDRRYGHILDPRTGWPAHGVISVTVVAETATDADAWGTALFVLGPDAARAKALEEDGISAILITPGSGPDTAVDTVYVEDTLADDFSLVPEAAGRFHVVVFP